MKTSGQKKRSLYKLKVYVEDVFPDSSVTDLAANYTVWVSAILYYFISHCTFIYFQTITSFFFKCTDLQTLKERIMQLVNECVWLQGERWNLKSWLCEQSVQPAGVGGVNDSRLRIINSHWFLNTPKIITSKGKITVFLLCWMETWWKRIRFGVWVAFTLEEAVKQAFTVHPDGKRNHVNEHRLST